MSKINYVRPAAEGTYTTADGQAAVPDTNAHIDPTVEGEAMLRGEETRPLVTMDNLDQFRRRGVRPGGLITRILRKFVARKYTPEEVAKMDEIQRRKALEKILTADAKTWEGYMINCLDALGFKHIVKKEGEVVRHYKVSFDYIGMEPDAIHFHVNNRKPVPGLSTDDLVSEETIRNLSVSVSRRVTCRWSAEAGIWYTIERASGRAGIRNHVAVADMWEAMPASANSLTIPIGMTHNSKSVYSSISEWPHGLVAGTTGAGKSNFEHVLICTLMKRNTPAQCQLLLIDLKGGLEFSRYAGLPHLRAIPENEIAPKGLITEREKVPALLEWLIKYGEKRMAMLLASNCSNIGEYNAHKKTNRLPFLVVVIDEWADVRLSKIGKDAEESLINIVQRMRAVGIHVILSTQIPKSEVLTGLVKGNLPCRFAFSVPNIHASMAIMDTGDAAGLEPTGRCIMQNRGETEIQTPYISREIIQTTIDDIRNGTKTELTGHDVTPREIWEWSLTENDGWLNVRALLQRYGPRGITQAELRGWLIEWTYDAEKNPKEFVIGSSSYRVMDLGGPKGRRLIAVKETA